MKMYTLTGADGEPYQSPIKGALGGNRGTKVYGLMTCKTAARYVAAGTYQKSRVFLQTKEQRSQRAIARAPIACRDALRKLLAAFERRHEQRCNERAFDRAI